ncbi:MAG TPA: diguanylate cyclase, partial [Candidatus Xenobia bacterium]
MLARNQAPLTSQACTVLLVDDQVMMAETVRRMLQGFDDIRFESCQDPTQGIEHALRLCPTVILLDLVMPQVDGMTLLRFLKSHPTLKKIPVVVLSSQEDADGKSRAFGAGASDYLVKLPHAAELVARIRAHSESYRTWLERDEALRESEERYALAVEGARDGLWDWHLSHNELFYSPRWKAMLGYEADELGSQPEEWMSRVHEEDLPGLQHALSEHLAGRTGHFEHEHRMRHRDGDWRWMLSRGLAMRGPDGKAARMAGSQTDISVRRHAEDQLVHHAFHDPLTNLPNRALFTKRLTAALELARVQPEYCFAVLFLDLDRFKVINDSLGHVVGDQVLQGIAGRLLNALRPTDMVARLGGDEFAVLLDDLRQHHDAALVAERIQRDLETPTVIHGRDVYSTASVGIALSDLRHEKAEDFLRDADTAMYRAKAAGRSRYELFDTAMHHRAVEQLHLENDLWKAVERGELVLYYQPVVSLRSRRIVGAEALLRWLHPQRGMVSPAEFIPLAEETGQIIPIGRWVIQEACRQSSTWQALGLGELRVMVNVSAQQFRHQDLPAVVGAALHETGVQPSALALEITESTAMQNMERTIEILDQLRRMDIRIAI